MAKEQNHVQAILEKKTPKGVTVQHSWIPEKHAIVGHFVKLKNEDGTWDDGWEVTGTAMQNPMPSKWVQERSMDYKKMRSMTDI